MDVNLIVDPPVTPALRDEVVSLWVRVTQAGGAVGFVPPVTEEDIRPVADATLEDVTAGRAHLVTARDGEDLVGLAFVEPRKPPLFDHIVRMRRLQVDPERQGEGIGAQIVEAVHELARRQDRRLIQITARGGTGVERFYRQQGYDLVARLPGVIKVGPDEFRDELVLLKRL